MSVLLAGLAPEEAGARDIQLLGVKGPASVPANLMDPMRSAPASSASRSCGQASMQGNRTIWRDRDPIAARMVEAIAAERRDRGLT